MDKNKAKINKVSAISYGIKKILFTILLISPFLFPSHASAVACTFARYWVGGTGTWDASDTAHWAATTGGAGGASVPNGGSTCTFFDASSGGGTVTLGYSPSVASMTMGAFTGTFDAATFSPTFSGVSTAVFSNTGTGTRTLNMGSGTWTLSSASISPVWNITDPTNLTLNAQTSTVKITGVSTSALTFAGGSQIYNNVWFARGTSTGSNVVSGSNTFNDFKDDGSVAHKLYFNMGTTQTVSTFTVSGSSGNLISLLTGNGGPPALSTHSLIKTGGGTISSDYLNVLESVATPANTWYAGTHSTDNQDLGSGWIFTAPPPDYTFKGFFRFLRGVFRFK